MASIFDEQNKGTQYLENENITRFEMAIFHLKRIEGTTRRNNRFTQELSVHERELSKLYPLLLEE